MRRTTLILLAIAASFVVNGLVDPIVPRQHMRALALVHGLLIGVLCYVWVRAEAFQRQSFPPGKSALVAGLFPLLGVPIYLFRTRGTRGGLIGTAKAFGFVVVLAVVSGVLSEIVLALVSKP